MPDTETVASVATEAPSVADAPTPSAPASYPSDDAILDGEPTAEKPAEDADGKGLIPAEEAKPVAEGDKPVAEEKKDDDEGPLTEHIEPEELKRVFKAHPELRTTWYSEKAFREVFPTVAEAREFKSVFPTLDIARRAAEHQSVLLGLDQLYATDPKAFAERLQQGNPDAFFALLRDSRDVAYAANPKAYRDNYAEPAVRDAVENMRDLAEQHGDEDLAAAVKIFEDRLGWAGQPQGGKLPDTDPRIKAYEQLKAQAEQGRQGAFNQFSNAADRGVDDGIEKAVREAIGKQSGMSDKAVDRVVKDVAEGVKSDVRSRDQVLRLYDAKKRSGNGSQEHYNETINFLLTHAKQFIPAKVRTHLNEWTNEILRTNAADREKQKAVPERKEVGGGTTTQPTSKIPTNPDPAFYRKHTDREILDL